MKAITMNASKATVFITHAHFARTGLLMLVITVLLGVAGCAVGPNYRRPETRISGEFSTSSAYTTNAIELEWWKSFNDARLQALVEQALDANRDVQFATARLREARALRNDVRFDLAPTIRNDNYYQNQLASQAAQPGLSREQRESELYHAGFDATWELDVFGRVRRNVQAANADLEAVAANRRDVVISIVAEVARNYFDLRGLQARLDVARRNATNQNDSLKLAQDRLAGGTGTRLDVARAEAQLKTTLASIPAVESAVQRAINRLAVLTAQQPGSWGAELRAPQPLPSAAAIVSIGDPQTLLRRRPDIQAAERSLAAATARIGVNTADLFPRVTFNGSVALEGQTFSALGNAGSETWNFGPRISWAAFDLGRVRQRVKAATARTDAALANYEQTVLLALEETDNALNEFGKEQLRRDLLREAVAAGETSAALSRQRYQDGATDFLAVLDAERVLLELQDSLVISETRTSVALVFVYKALGGGWTVAEEVAVAQ